MLTNHKGRFSVFRTILIAIFLLQGVSTTSLAQGDLTPSELLKEAMQLMQSQQYDEAIDYMLDYISLVGTSKSERVQVIAQDVRFKVASLLVIKERKDEAAEVLETYIANPFAKHMRQAHKMLVACYLESESKKYEECIQAVKNALEYDKNPTKTARITIDVDDPFADDELTAVEPDEPYSSEEIEMLYFAWGDSHFKLEQMEECIEPYTYVIDNTSNLQRKGYCIMQVINALTELEGFDRIIAWVPQLYMTTARYDIRVNIALLGVASALYDAGEYDSALPLYRMILPRDELIAYQEKQVRKMRIDAGLPPELGEAMTAEEALLFGEEDSTRTAIENPDMETIVEAQDDMEMQKPKELKELEGLLDTLKGMSPYQDHVNFQMAQLYKKVERYWEAVEFFETVFEADPTSLIGERSIYEAVAIVMDMLGDREAAEKRAFAYLDEYREGQYPRLVTYVLVRYYQSQRDWKSIKAVYPYIKEFIPDDNPDIIKFDTEMYFMQGVSDLMLQSYSNAVQGFQYVIETYPGTTTEGNSLFWCGFSYLCLDEYENAFNSFERYARDFPDGDLLDEAYFQGGISLFGLDRLSEAKDRFAYVIDTFGPASSVYPDSCSRRGDILGAEGGDLLDVAVEDYRNAFDAATKVTQATYATFQMCEIFKADDAHYGAEPVIQAVNLYLAKWGDVEGADLAKALFWLGRTKIQQQRYEEAADSYLEAVIDYGGTLRQDGVDLMIPELVKIAQVFLTEEQREAILTRMRLAMESTDNETLRLRLRVALAQFDDSVLELGKQLIQELPDLEHASPPVLAAICEASFAMKDYSRSEELLRTFKYNFEDSQYMRSAYKLRASGQYARGDYEGTMLTIADAQAEYGTDRDAAWAQLMKADILRLESLMFKSDEPLSQDLLALESTAQLEIAQGQLETVNANLVKAQEDQLDKEVERILAEQLALNDRISDLELAVQGSSSENEVRALLAQCKIDAAREENKNVFGVPDWRGEPEAQAIFQLGQVEEANGNPRLAHGYYQRAYFQYKGHAKGYWAAEGYLASARCLKQLSEDTSLSATERKDMDEAVRNTYRAMLFDKYVNQLPQAEIAREALSESEVSEIVAFIDSGVQTNIVIEIEGAVETTDTDKDNSSSEPAFDREVNDAGGDE